MAGVWENPAGVDSVPPCWGAGDGVRGCLSGADMVCVCSLLVYSRMEWDGMGWNGMGWVMACDEGERDEGGRSLARSHSSLARPTAFHSGRSRRLVCFRGDVTANGRTHAGRRRGVPARPCQQEMWYTTMFRGIVCNTSTDF